ncbi:MAG: hypothetical protein ABI867_12170 [Kofleriaceae bacterium]
MRWLLIVGLLAAVAHAEPPPGQPRWFVSVEVASGAGALDDIEWAQSFSLAVGIHVLPGLVGVARLRETSPVRGSLADDAFTGWLLFDDPGAPAPPQSRVHQTELTAGLRLQGKALWAEALFGPQLRYLPNGAPGFDNRALWILDTAIGVRLTKPSRGDSADLGVFVGAGIEPLTGRFARTLLGVELTADFL